MLQFAIQEKQQEIDVTRLSKGSLLYHDLSAGETYQPPAIYCAVIPRKKFSIIHRVI